MTASTPTHGPDAEVAAWLCGASGLAHVADAAAAFEVGATELSVASRLRETLDPDRANAVVDAAATRRRAVGLGYPDADRWVFTREALEQASRPEVAAWRATRFAGADAVTDLCAGVGADAAALLRRVGRVRAVEIDRGRAVLAEHNLGTVSGDSEVVCGDATAERPTGLVHVDPARRGAGKRLRTLAEYQPAIGSLVDAMADADGWGVAVAPGIDERDRDLPPDVEIEYVQVGRDLVEATLWWGSLRGTGDRTATLLPEGLTRTRSAIADELSVAPLGDWFAVPVPALVRARLHDEVGAEVGGWRVARDRALLSGDGPPPTTPWLRAERVLAVVPLRQRELAAWLRANDGLPLEFELHGVEADLAAWWRSVGRPDRGPNGRRVHLVRGDGRSQVVITGGRGGPDGS